MPGLLNFRHLTSREGRTIEKSAIRPTHIFIYRNLEGQNSGKNSIRPTGLPIPGFRRRPDDRKGFCQAFSFFYMQKIRRPKLRKKQYQAYRSSESEIFEKASAYILQELRNIPRHSEGAIPDTVRNIDFLRQIYRDVVPGRVIVHHLHDRRFDQLVSRTDPEFQDEE